MDEDIARLAKLAGVPIKERKSLSIRVRRFYGNEYVGTERWSAERFFAQSPKQRSAFVAGARILSDDAYGYEFQLADKASVRRARAWNGSRRSMGLL